MNIHYLQHVPFEGLARIEEWIRTHGHRLSSTRFFRNDELPQLSDIDWLIIMGGPMSVNDEHIFPWLKPEKQFIRGAIDRGCKVLGICLGAQLIAAALGARVHLNSEKEIGWFPITLTEEGKTSIFFRNYPEEFYAFHWHGETFDIPHGGKRLASSEACRNQAFSYGDSVLALQFHLDMQENNVMDLVSHSAADHVSTPFVQKEEEMVKEEKRFEEISEKMKLILECFETGRGMNDRGSRPSAMPR